jgi:tetratricopeptide (TPR) repeat protein
MDKAIELYKKCLEQDPKDAAANYELASILSESGKVYEALPFAEKAVDLDASNRWYKDLLIQLYQAQGKYSEAGVIIDQLLVAEPDNIEYYYDKALNSLYDGDYKNAVKSYDLLEQKMGINEDISIQKEKIYIMMGKTDKAIEEIKKLTVAFPDEPRYLEMLAELYMTSGMSEEALDIYNEILKIDPGNPYINISLSDYYRKKGDKDKSLEYLKAGFANPALDIDSKISILLAYYSVTEIYSSFKEEAFELAAILIKAHPDDPKAFSIYADFLVQDKRYTEAREAFRTVISLDSTKYLVWEQMLFVESELGDNQAMADESKRALQMFPDQPMLYLFAGAASFQLKNFEDAAKYFRTGANFVVGNDKMLAQFYSYLGDSYFQLKDHEKSDEAYEKVLKIEPDNVLVLNNYAYYLSLRNRDLDRAEKMSKRTLELEPDNSSYLDTYGWILFKLGRYKEAEEWIKKAMEKGEQSAVVIEHYGDVLWKLGDNKEAVKYWEKALKAGQGSEFLEKKVQDKTYYE